MSEEHSEKKYSNLVITLLLLFPVLINSVKIFGNLILLILAIIGAYIAITEKKNPFQIREMKVFSWLVVSYFGVMLLSILIADGFNAEFHHLGRKLQFLLAPFIALAIFQIDLPLKKLLFSIKVGLIFIGVIVISQFLLGLDRPSGMINANIFGDIAVAMVFLSIVQIFRETPRERVLTFIAVLAGISAIFLSESRGSWLSFLILSIVYIGLIYKLFLKNNNKRQLLLVLLFSIIFGFIGTQTNASKLIKTAINNVQSWHIGDESNTSSGLRMQMWKSGLTAAKQSPWFGYGYRNANKAASEYAPNNERAIRIKTHLHNEYITNFVSAGVIGLLMLLTLLFIPMIIFYQKLKYKDTYYYSTMGVLLCVGYITFGFTHIAFGEEHINAFYVFFLGLLLPKVMKETTTKDLANI
jgi:O-antigen ligase